MLRKVLILLCVFTCFNSMTRSEKVLQKPVPFLGIAPIIQNTAAFKTSESLQLKNGSTNLAHFSNSTTDLLKPTTVAPAKIPGSNNFTPYSFTESPDVPAINPMNFSCDHLNFSLPEPEKCCNFPVLLPDEIVDKCEKEFGLNISSVNNDILSDSVI